MFGEQTLRPIKNGPKALALAARDSGDEEVFRQPHRPAPLIMKRSGISIWVMAKKRKRKVFKDGAYVSFQFSSRWSRPVISEKPVIVHSTRSLRTLPKAARLWNSSIVRVTDDGSYCFPFKEIVERLVALIYTIFYCRCKIPGYGNDTYDIHDVHHAWLVNQTIPITEDGDYSPCTVYDVTVYDDRISHANGSQRNCDEWVYDKSIFRETLASKVCVWLVWIQTFDAWCLGILCIVPK